jgi:hypothetical protein
VAVVASSVVVGGTHTKQVLRVQNKKQVLVCLRSAGSLRPAAAVAGRVAPRAQRSVGVSSFHESDWDLARKLPPQFKIKSPGPGEEERTWRDASLPAVAFEMTMLLLVAYQLGRSPKGRVPSESKRTHSHDFV